MVITSFKGTQLVRSVPFNAIELSYVKTEGSGKYKMFSVTINDDNKV